MNANVTSSLASDMSEGMKAGVELATMQNQIQDAQTKSDMMKTQLASGQMQNASQMLSNYAKMDPRVRKMAGESYKAKAKQMGVPMDSSFDMIDNDPSYANNVQQIMNSDTFKQQMHDDPRGALLTLQQHMNSDPMDMNSSAEKIRDQLIKMDQENNNLKIAQTKANASEYGADQRLKAQTGTGGLSEVRQQRMETAANKMYESGPIGKTESALDAATKTRGIVDSVIAGEAIATQPLAADLQSSIASLISGGKAATVSGTHAQEFKSAYSNLAKIQSYITGTPNAVLTKNQLDQVKKDVNIIEKEYADQHERAFNKVSAGMSGQNKEIFNNRYHAARRGYGLEQESSQSANEQTNKPNDQSQATSGKKTKQASQDEMAKAKMAVDEYLNQGKDISDLSKPLMDKYGIDLNKILLDPSINAKYQQIMKKKQGGM